MANGTLATFAALKALGVNNSDEVIIPNLTFAATANSVILAGGIPKFCDVKLDDFSIDLKQAENLITKKTKAIIPVHLYGKTADMAAVNKFARKYRLNVIEDAAQGIGVFYNGKHSGTLSQIGILSFYGNKTITTGEGGVCLTDCDELANSLFRLKNHGRDKKGTFVHQSIGFNFAFTDLQAAVGLSQMKKLDKIIDKRFEIYRAYLEALEDDLCLVKYNRKIGELPWLNSIKIKNPDKLEKFLDKSGIIARRFFYPLDLQPCYKNSDYMQGSYPNSHYLYNNYLSLPSSHMLTKEDLKLICGEIEKYISLR